MAKIFKEKDHLTITVRNARECQDYELLFLSREIPFSRKKGPSRWTLVVYEPFIDEAQKEIELYQIENQSWRPSYIRNTQEVFRFPLIHETVLLCLAIFHWRVRYNDSYLSWTEKGRASAEHILSGEWARAVTALTLHGDYFHLFSNLAALWVFVIVVRQYVGMGVAWLIVLLAGALGNIMSAYFYATDHFSIGASTAVFGAVGILGGMRTFEGFHERESWKRRLMPFAAVLALLALLGANPKSDVMAHLFGLVAGLGVGLLWAFVASAKIVEKETIQWMAIGLFGSIVFVCWMVRLASA